MKASHDDELLESLSRKMKQLEVGTSAFSNPKQIKSRKVHWINPELVAQVSFTEWTSGNKLRHPSFLGLREDKDPEDGVQEK